MKSIEQQFQDSLEFPGADATAEDFPEGSIGREAIKAGTPAIDTLPDPDVLVHEQPATVMDLPGVDDGPPTTRMRPHIGMAEEIPTTADDADLEFGDDLPPQFDLEPQTVHPLVAQAGAGAGMMVVPPNPLTMLAGALERGVDVSKLERLFDLAERHEREVQRKAFAAALSDFQGDVAPINDNKTAFVNTSDGGSYSYTYADLDQIMATIRPTLKACGLSVTYDTAIAEDGRSIKSLCYVMHRGGHVEVRTFVCPVDEKLKINDSQKVGSANAYASRYNVTNALGLTTGEDDDGAVGDTRRGATVAPKKTDIDEFFPVGKWKGYKWDQVPLDYLEWAAGNMTDKADIVAKCKEQIELRIDADQPAPDVEGELTMAECARAITGAKTAKELSDIWSLVPEKHVDGLAAWHATRQTELKGK